MGRQKMASFTCSVLYCSNQKKDHGHEFWVDHEAISDIIWGKPYTLYIVILDLSQGLK